MQIRIGNHTFNPSLKRLVFGPLDRESSPADKIKHVLSPTFPSYPEYKDDEPLFFMEGGEPAGVTPAGAKKLAEFLVAHSDDPGLSATWSSSLHQNDREDIGVRFDLVAKALEMDAQTIATAEKLAPSNDPALNAEKRAVGEKIRRAVSNISRGCNFDNAATIGFNLRVVADKARNLVYLPPPA